LFEAERDKKSEKQEAHRYEDVTSAKQKKQASVTATIAVSGHDTHHTGWISDPTGSPAFRSGTITSDRP
jgi:hypothetical protein